MNVILSFLVLFALRIVLPFSLILIIGEKVRSRQSANFKAI